ncbi:MAG: hypothetical protein ACON4W_09050 [Parvibaculales bacterium]
MSSKIIVTSMTAVFGLLFIIIFSFASDRSAKNSQQISLETPRNIHVIFECIHLANYAGENKEALGEPMSKAIEQGRVFLKALLENKLSQEQVNKIPFYWWGVLSKQPIDFQLGQIFERSFDPVRDLDKDNNYWKAFAENEYQQRNCSTVLSQ